VSDDVEAPAKEDIDAVAEAMRAIAPAASEPDWSALAATISRAVDDEARRLRRRRRLLMGGVVLAAAAVAALLVWPVARHRSHDTARAPAPVDAAPIQEDDLDLDEETVTDELALPDDLGGITVDDDLIDEAAAALDDDLDELDDDALDDRLLPDGAWIDDLSDEDLDRVVELLDQEAG
jgi:hypothetical protein